MSAPLWPARRIGHNLSIVQIAFASSPPMDEGTLAFGTAGGCFYVSDDRGESWRTLGSHLPPIYSVRFG